MEEIEYKLRKKNAVLVVNAISKLVETIKTKGAPHSNRIEELPELQLLKEKCEDSEPLINMAACQGMVALVETGTLSVIPTLTSFIASLSSVRNYSGTVSAIGALLITDLQARIMDKKQYQCPFGMKVPQHPFITVLRHSKETCFHVLSQIQHICNHPAKNVSDNSMELLRPVFLYALCDPSLTSRLPILCRRQMWTLLLHSTSTEFLLELISWFQIEGEAEVFNMSCMLVELAELAVRNNNAVLCAALAPFVASTTHRLVCYGYDPSACLTVLIQLLEFGPEAGSVVLSVLSNAVGTCPVPYLKDIISCCIWMVNSKLCNLLSAGMLVSSLLQWLLYPSYITGEALQLATTALGTVKPDTNWVSRTSQLCRNKHFSTLRCFDAFVDLTTEICRISETWQSNPESAKDWLQRFCEHLPSGEHWMPILSGMFIHHLGDTTAVLQLLLKLVERNADLAGHVLTLLLYKLSSEREPQCQLQMLHALTKMAVQKENVTLVLHTLESLKHNINIRPLLLDLYVRLWKVETRCYPYLQKLLIDKEKSASWELNIAKAMVTKEICDTRPGQYGADLVKLLSQILNESGGEEGAIPSSLALKGITSLCQAQIVDIATTWRALAPKLTRDKRPLVLQSLCEFFKVVVTQRITNQEYEKLVTEVVTRLWAFASNNSSHPDVARAAFGTLSYCEMEQLSLKTLPECYKQNLKLPSSYVKTPMDAARKPEDVLNYIPGECWIQLLQKTREEVLDAAGDMLTKWIASEVQLFRSGVYNAPRGEPTSYTQLHHRSVLKAISSHVSAKAECDPEDEMALIRQCLRVLAYKGYCQPLPPLNWKFLTSYLPYPELRPHCLTLAAVQAAGSPSARAVVENCLRSLETTEQKVEEIILFYDCLEQLCKGIAPNVLKPFLEKTLNFSLMRGDTEESSLLSKLLAQVKAALRREDIHDANRQMLSLVVESLLEKLDINDKVFEDYTSCVTELSSKYVERMSSPSVWWEVTPEKLRQSFIIRSALASKGDTEVPLVWLNECIDATLNLPGEHTSVLGRLASVVSQCREHDSNSRWTMELLGQIHVVLNKKNEEDVQQSLIFLCDVFILTVVVISGHDLCALTLDSIVASRESRLVLFPQALATLLTKDSWNSLSSQIMEWVYHMQNASAVPDLYADVFHRTLVALRHTKYFKDSNVWMRFLLKPSFCEDLRQIIKSWRMLKTCKVHILLWFFMKCRSLLAYSITVTQR